MPGGTPYVFANYPTPNSKEKEHRNKKKNNSHNEIRNDEINRKMLKTQIDNITKKRNIRLKMKEEIRLPSNRATSRPRALERRSDEKVGEREMGDGSGKNNGMHNHARVLKHKIYKKGMAN